MLKVATAVDVGNGIHPKQCDLQNEGSALAGLGSALFEEMRFRQRSADQRQVPGLYAAVDGRSSLEFSSVLVETPHPDGPYGAKGVGEAALPPMAPAIGNAVANALGGARKSRSTYKARQDRCGSPSGQRERRG